MRNIDDLTKIPDFTDDVDELIKRFEQALRDIQAELRALSTTNMQRKELLEAQRVIRNRLSDITKYTEEWSETRVEEAILGAIIAAKLAMGLAVIADELFSSKQRQFVTLSTDALISDITAVTQSIERQTNVAIRKMQVEAMRSTELTRSAVNDIIDGTDIAIIDRAGRRWKTQTYLDVLANTSLMNAYRDAAVLEGLTSGNGLGQITSHPKTRDACLNHQGKIVKLSPDVPGDYPYYRDLSHIWHPSCRHRIIPLHD